MKDQNQGQILEKVLRNVRRALFWRSFFVYLARTSLIFLPLLAVAIAGDQRWNDGRSSLLLAGLGAGMFFLIPLTLALLGLGDAVRGALMLDDRAELKDRVSSAYEFLKEGGELDEAHAVQVRDAIERAQKIDCSKIFQFRWPKYSSALPIVAVLLILSFFMPGLRPAKAVAVVDPAKMAQIEQLKELERELAQKDEHKELEDVLKKLQQLRERFDKGEINERDVLLQLARLDEDLRNKTQETGAENLEKEMNTILPHLMSSSASRQVASAIKEDKLDKAAEELQKLDQKVARQELSNQDKRELAMNMGMAASKLGGKDKSAFGGDFSKASESLEKSDSEGFSSACKSIGEKLQTMKKCRSMASACNKLGLCKSGFCQSKEQGFSLAPKALSKGKGGLKAGTGASGNPLGEDSRLASSYRKMLQVSGQAGEGPVQSEVEITDGQLSASQLDLKEVHANFAAVAEEAIEKESIPLSHRYHVKRYFQAIRPQE